MTATVPYTPRFIDMIDTSVDDEFAIGAARYLRNAGLSTEAIAESLADELDLNEADAARYAKAA